jgi:hypothetical protein
MTDPLRRTATDRITELKAQRDRARTLTVTLEQQNATLTAALNVALYHATHPEAVDRDDELGGCYIALADATGPQEVRDA